MVSKRKLRASASNNSLASNASTSSVASSVGGGGVSPSAPKAVSAPKQKYVASPGTTNLEIHESQICTQSNCGHIAGYHYLIEAGGRCNFPGGCACAGLKVT